MWPGRLHPPARRRLVQLQQRMALKPWFPKAAVIGGLLAALFFVVTISFMITTSGIGE